MNSIHDIRCEVSKGGIDSALRGDPGRDGNFFRARERRSPPKTSEVFSVAFTIGFLLDSEHSAQVNRSISTLVVGAMALFADVEQAAGIVRVRAVAPN
jgi:hypothetical protein